jgi:hypothetical protein
MMRGQLKRLALALGLFAAGCSRSTETFTAGNVNIRLTFTPAKVSADEGTTLVTVDVDNFAGDPLRLDDIKINTSAGYDKVGAITANSATRFTAALQGLTDLKQSPVKVTVSVGRALQTGYIEIVPGAPSGLKLELDKDMVSADEGTANLKLRIVDKAQNVTPSAITLTTTAGVVSQLVSQPDGSYTAKLTGLVHTEDSPVSISASAGDSRAEATVQILAGVLDHFAVSDVPSPIVAGEFMPLTASARDAHGNLVTAFEDFVTVRTTRSASDVEVSHKDAGGNYVTAANFTRQFNLGLTPANPGEEFRVKTAAPAPGIGVIVSDTAGHRGQTNTFVVDPAPANQVIIYSQTGYNLIVSADGCVKPGIAGVECLTDAVSVPGQSCTINSASGCLTTPLATRLEIKLRRYTASPDEVDGVATLLGGRGNDFLLTMTDADGAAHCAITPPGVTPAVTCAAEKAAGLPYLGAIEDKQNGKYYVNVYNLRDQAKSPYTVTARFVSLVESIDVSVVPGNLSRFSFPPMPAQRAGALGLFVLTVTARDYWENQVFSFQDTTSVWLKMAGQPAKVLTQAPSATLGQTFPFTVTLDTSAGQGVLIAQHGSGVTGASDSFQLVAGTHPVTNFAVFMPGQFNPPCVRVNNANQPAGCVPPPCTGIGNPPGCLFPSGGLAGLTPDLGVVTSSEPVPDQVVGEPFEIMITGRVQGVNAPLDSVSAFGGRVLVGGLGAGIEVVDDSCLNSLTPPAGVAPSQLTPPFQRIFTGAQSVLGTGSYEYACYVWVRATATADAAIVTADAGRSSGIPVSANGDQSAQVRVRSAEAVALRFASIPTPQLATVNPAGGKNTFTIQVRGIDQFGNTTDNVYCNSPVVTSNLLPVNGQDALQYTKTPAPKFDVDGVLTITDAWLYVQAPPKPVQLTVSCGVAGMTAQSNTFTAVASGAAGYEFMLVPPRVKSHTQFTFSARACSAMDGLGKHCATENDVARTFTYAVTMTDASLTLVPKQTRMFTSGILDAQPAMIDKAGTTQLCLYSMGAFSCSDPFIVEIGDVSYFQFDTTAFPSTVVVGTAYDVAFTAYDAGGNAMPNYTGRIYLSDNQGRAIIANNGQASADVTTVTVAGKPQLKYCTTAACTTTQNLQVVFSDMASLDYLIATDNRGHTGYSLPKTFRIVYGPVGNVVRAPCENNTLVRQQAYFTLCAQAQAWDARLGQWVLKRDYTSSGDTVVANRTLYPNTTLPFQNGTAQHSYYVASVTSNVTVSYYFLVAGTRYPASGSYAFDAYAVAPRAVTATTSVPVGLKVNTPFKLHLQVKNGGAVDTVFGGVLRVTDTTGSVQPYCGTTPLLQPAGTCGYVEGATLVTGNLTEGFGGERDQWLTIPTENYGGYLWVSDGFTQTYRVGPFDVEGNLKTFTFSPIPSKIAAGVYQRVLITAWDIDDAVMTSFRAPVQLTNVTGKVTPFAIPATAWTNGVADIAFKIPDASTGLDKLTVKFQGSTVIQADSDTFTVETPKLSKFVWSGVPAQQAGYVDFPIQLTARDQFGSQFLYSGKVTLTTNTANYAVRPALSKNFINGVLGDAGNPQLIAIDGPAQGNVRLIAMSATGAPVTGASNPVTVAASTVGSFSVAITSATLKANCTYGLVIQALSGTGSLVTNFSGTVGLRWTATAYPLYVAVANPDTASFDPATTPKFVNGVLTTTVKVLGQPASNMFNLPPPDMNLEAWIPLTLIRGTTTATYDVQLAGTCP